MICYKCENIKDCSLFHDLHTRLGGGNFIINGCNDFNEMSSAKYMHIAEHDSLMALIYDYFTDGIDYEKYNQTKQDVEEKIREILLCL
jgi:hypothetical protein